MSIEYYFTENAKLGEKGHTTGIAPEKTFEEILREHNYQDKYLKTQDERGMNPCFFYCSGKYSYFSHLSDDIRKDMWHMDRYIMYLRYILKQAA